MAKNKGNIWVWIIAAVVVLLLFGVINLPSFDKEVTSGDDVIQTYAADAAYATQNAFSSEAITGTSYYASESGIFQTTAPKLDRGDEYTYWVSNSTVYVKPFVFTASGSDNIVNKMAYRTADATISGRDVINDCNVNEAVTGTSCNMTLGANEQAKIDVKYLGGAKTANLPFGGVMVVEYNSTVPTVTCSGDGIVGPNSKYQVTYAASATSHTFKVYEIADGFDVSNGITGVTKVIRCEFVNGDTAVQTGDTVKVSFLGANYYLGNDGKVYLDVEQKMNSATTRTGLDDQSEDFYVN